MWIPKTRDRSCHLYFCLRYQQGSRERSWSDHGPLHPQSSQCRRDLSDPLSPNDSGSSLIALYDEKKVFVLFWWSESWIQTANIFIIYYFKQSNGRHIGTDLFNHCKKSVYQCSKIWEILEDERVRRRVLHSIKNTCTFKNKETKRTMKNSHSMYMIKKQM